MLSFKRDGWLVGGLLAMVACTQQAADDEAEATRGNVLRSHASEQQDLDDVSEGDEEHRPDPEPALPLLGATCEQAYDRDRPVCADELACAYGVCSERALDLGERCDINEDLCLPGTLCVSLGEMNTQGICKPRRELGESCSYGFDCAHGLRCERPTKELGVCKARFKLGEACHKSGFGYDCELGLECVASECVPERPQSWE